MRYRARSSSRTDRGKRRATNEDAVLELPEHGVWVIADGMGGHSRGDMASRYVVEALQDVGPARRLRELVAKARLRLNQANDRIYREARKAGANVIMGSTAVVFLASRGKYCCLWAGDSRAYRLRDGTLEQLTRDHSLLQELLDRGEVPASEARGHPAASRITRAVGVQPRLRIDETRGHIRPGDVFLLCSDGLPLEAESDEIAALLERFDHEQAARGLLELSLQRGARDNISLAVVHFEEEAGFECDLDATTALNHTFQSTTTQQWTLSG